MSRKLLLKCIALLVTLMLLTLAGCGSDSSPTASDPAVLVSSEQVATFNSFEDVQQAMLSGGSDQLTISNTLGSHDTLANAVANGAVDTNSIDDLVKLIKSVWDEGFLPYTRTPIVISHKITYK